MLYQNQLVYLFLISITEIISLPTQILPCEDSPEDCLQSQQHLFDSLSTTNSTYVSTTRFYAKRSPTSFNLNRFAIIIACTVLVIGAVRICFLLCKQSARCTTPRRRSTIRPEISTIEESQFKPDLPPAYAAAIENHDSNENKLPSYDEVNSVQQHSHNTVRAQM
ncbi:unnamed protein product [Adineta ricciae]|uniref:Uncharacterized protein n=1 Tax=Adineta ricciae TaxID=249248 RepID=A0A814TX58_ADIRI|nr:unnamed protein product [Adineta ricciae]CAF1168310.1 unnamed protein product [Adineta ricciae]